MNMVYGHGLQSIVYGLQSIVQSPWSMVKSLQSVAVICTLLPKTNEKQRKIKENHINTKKTKGKTNKINKNQKKTKKTLGKTKKTIFPSLRETGWLGAGWLGWWLVRSLLPYSWMVFALYGRSHLYTVFKQTSTIYFTTNTIQYYLITDYLIFQVI